MSPRVPLRLNTSTFGFRNVVVFIAYICASLIAQWVKNLPAKRRPWFDSWVGETPWRRDRLPTPVSWGFPGGSAGKEYACNAGDLDSIPGSGRSPGKGKGYPLQYSGEENSRDCIVHGVAKDQTQLSDFHFLRFAVWQPLVTCGYLNFIFINKV